MVVLTTLTSRSLDLSVIRISPSSKDESLAYSKQKLLLYILPMKIDYEMSFYGCSPVNITVTWTSQHCRFTNKHLYHPVKSNIITIILAYVRLVEPGDGY